MLTGMAMWTKLTALAVCAGLLTLSPGAADACSCMSREPADYVASADQVFIGRGHAERNVGNQTVQRVDVLHALKGAVPGGRIETRRPANEGGGCDRTFSVGEIALVFTSKGKISYCDGNYALSVVLPRMHDYLGALGGAGPAKAEVVAQALTSGQVGEGLPRKGRVAVALPAHQGKTIQVGGRSFAFVGAERGALVIKEAVTRGTLHFVSVEDPTRNATGHLLARDGKGGLELLGEHVVKGKAP
jgi:hypothetical protein